MSKAKSPTVRRRPRSMDPAALALLDDVMGRMEMEQASIRAAFEIEIARLKSGNSRRLP